MFYYTYPINKIITYTDRNGIDVTTEYQDSLRYESEQTEEQVTIDTNNRVNEWILVQQAPLPPDPAPVYQINSDDGTFIDI